MAVETPTMRTAEETKRVEMRRVPLHQGRLAPRTLRG